jgi:hypothetical protein
MRIRPNLCSKKAHDAPVVYCYGPVSPSSVRSFPGLLLILKALPGDAPAQGIWYLTLPFPDPGCHAIHMLSGILCQENYLASTRYNAED